MSLGRQLKDNYEKSVRAIKDEISRMDDEYMIKFMDELKGQFDRIYLDKLKETSLKTVGTYCEKVPVNCLVATFHFSLITISDPNREHLIKLAIQTITAFFKQHELEVLIEYRKNSNTCLYDFNVTIYWH